MDRRILRRGAGSKQQLRSFAVSCGPLDHVECLVDGSSYDRVEELDRIGATEEVEPNERGGGRPELAFLYTCERGGGAQFAPVAEDRGRAEEGERVRGQAGESKPDRPRYALRTDLQQPGHLGGRRTGSLPCDRVEHCADEQRISHRGGFEGSVEGIVWLQPVQLAREHGDGVTPERLRTYRDGLRVGNELRDQVGVVSLSLGRPGGEGHDPNLVAEL